ncbi:acetyl/propionyl/methylcrotonyl-CoA carboxylase subunit alpha [Embleya hyalina]|uniref:Acetyl/propionyl-CoA carboxylase subuit alpha n=1 Tax=Embleya hyalina TaxID=516124 RepID=A0A401YFF3_9ACTN|nr:biotin carboxylase N-terminal domain-containing protein [Embleya hyalina]GCD93309.1 acetyl/propionyl-CoA carboxylase subuit alpha [Embleya hyalina]
MPLIRRLLIANRGEIAVRIARTAHAMGIDTVAVYADPDVDSPHVAAADEAVRLPGSAAADTYLRGDLLIEAARTTGADTIHPGYGFLSENADFARRTAEAGLLFVGPTPDTIAAMGDKLAAKDLLGRAGVPVLPGGVVTPGSMVETAARIGFPLLVKAAFGGGGRGMRVVRDPGELPAAVAAARREAAAAFGDDTVFLERLVENPRHIEVQIFGDTHGRVIALFERDCSIQRRHQKLIEESPAPGIDPGLRAELCAAAVTAGRAIGYIGAGTVEFVLDRAGAFHLLEVNTRLQVEHPVTELTTGLDLVRLQLLVAQGHALPAEAHRTGHAIEARLYAEDPVRDYAPSVGTLHRFELAESERDGIRVDAGVVTGSRIGVHYDALLAKVIAYAPTREEACRKLARALARARVHGVRTNRDLLVGVLRSAEFTAGAADTGFLDRHAAADLCAADPSATPVHAAAAALAGQAERRSRAGVLATIPSGWRNVRDADQQVTYTSDPDTRTTVSYRLPDHVAIDGKPLPGLVIHAAHADRVELTADGIRRTVHVHRVGEKVYLDSPLGASVLTELPRLPEPVAAETEPAGSLLAPMPGTVVRIAVAEGQRVAAGQFVLAVEAMKMEHEVTAPYPGVVSHLPVGTGEAVDAGAVLAVVRAADPQEEAGLATKPADPPAVPPAGTPEEAVG